MADGSAQLALPIAQELVVDLFAGGGGASRGIARAYREPDVAVNHNPIAIAVHQANHPGTRHFACDVFEVDPLEATGGRPVGVLWASPDCRHHSKAKGGAPRSKRIRGLAWVVVRWAAACKPRLVHLENVEEFADWGPLTSEGKPCAVRKGHTFRQWVRQLERLGYRVEHRELIAADYGAPTIRKRLYVIARRDGRPIVWPKPSHSRTGAGGLPTWRTAAECIDWGLFGRSIFGRPKPLAANTQRRIAKGLWRYTLASAEPFIVTNTTGHPGAPISEPLRTVATGGHHALVDLALAPFLTEHANASTQRVFGADEPLRTQCAQVKGGHFAVVSASLVTLRNNANGADVASPLKTIAAAGEHHGLIGATLIQSGYGEREGQAPRVLDLNAPLGTVVAGGVKHALVAAHLTHLTHHGERSGNSVCEPLRTVTGAHRGEQAIVCAHIEQANGGFYDGDGRPADAPLSTVCASGANQRLVTAYLVKYYGQGGQWQACAEPMHTVPTKDRMGLVRTLQVPAAGLTAEQLAGARRCAEFLRAQLPAEFAEPADLVLLQHAGGWWVMVDITLRMLTPRELARAQGFPDSYVIERGADGRAITKTDQVRLIGNSVCPDVAEALIRANAADLIGLYSRAVA